MNIMDFVNSLQINMDDFENTGKLGFIEGISRIIINGLNAVDTTKRPVHCTDLKRETLYVKHDNAWEKENPDKANLKQAVQRVARINLSHLPKWVRDNPDYMVFEASRSASEGERLDSVTSVKESDSKKNYDYVKFSNSEGV